MLARLECTCVSKELQGHSALLALTCCTPIKHQSGAFYSSAHVHARSHFRSKFLLISVMLTSLHCQAAASKQTADGSKVRRQVLAGAVLVFVTMTFPKRINYERAKDLGVRVVVIDGLEEARQVAPVLVLQDRS